MGWTDLRQTFRVQIEADSEAPELSSFSYLASRATLVVKLTRLAPAAARTVPTLAGVVARTLGASTYTNRLPTRMSRLLPLQHPGFPTMFATEIASLQGRGPERGYAVRFSNRQEPGVFWQSYQHYRMAVVFTNVKYAVKVDDPRQQSEVYRFVERHVQLGIENLIRQGNTFKWVPAVPGFAGQSIAQGLVLRAKKGVVTFIWKNVNHIGLYGRTGLLWPNHIWDGVGKVNSVAFSGCPPGTLLLLPPKFIPLEVPFPSRFANDGSFTVDRGTADLNLAYDIEFPCSFILPTLDPAFNYDVGGAANKWKRAGHNLLPLPPGGNGPYFYPATMNGANDGQPLYEGYDFHQMFKLLPPG